MDSHEAAAGLNVSFKRCLQIGRPTIVGSVLVEHYSLIFRKLRLERAEISPGRRGGNNVDLKQSRLFELFAQHGSDETPFVIWPAALAIKDHDADRRGGARGSREEHRGDCERDHGDSDYSVVHHQFLSGSTKAYNPLPPPTSRYCLPSSS